MSAPSRLFLAPSCSENAQTFLIRYLTTFENEGPELLEESKEVALEAALGFVKAPAISQRSSLPHLAAVCCRPPTPHSCVLRACVSSQWRATDETLLQSLYLSKREPPGFAWCGSKTNLYLKLLCRSSD
ncbi:MAG: hypothetical protein EOO65_05070 [Methanosarcinales archaeon]|nr:MAG: hypothetical protein EOO65_05070 [Methanosarcinales archaeon]